MRIRSTKPEFYRSKTIAELEWGDRHVLKALESYVDDNGVGKDDVALFAADAFPRDMFRSPRETFRSLSRALQRFESLGLIARYEVDGEHLLYVDRWAERQRIDKPSRGRFRRPDGTLEYSEAVNPASYRNPPEVFGRAPEKCAPGTGEQGNRGTGEKDSCASADAEREHTSPQERIDAEFADWYQRYPRKRGKGQAVKAYRAARKKTDAATLLDALEQQTAALTARGPEYVPYPASWLNGERWEDEDDAPVDNVRYLPDGTVDESSLPPRQVRR